MNVVADLSSALARLAHVSLPLLAAGLVFAAQGEFRPQPEVRTAVAAEPRLVPTGVAAGS